MTTQDGLDSFYKRFDAVSVKTIKDLNILKEKTDKARRALHISLLLCFVPFLAIFFLTVFSSSKIKIAGGFWFVVSALVFFGAIVPAVIFGFKYARAHGTYRMTYKEFFSNRVFPNLLTNYEYKPHRGINMEQLQGLRMLRFGNIYSSEDYVEGLYKNVGFVKADLKIGEETRDEDGHEHIDYYFSGSWMMFEFPKRFATRLAVVGRGCREFAYPRDTKKFPTESVDFNRMFNVYMQDGLDMFYLLDPKMMEQLMALGEKCGGKIAFFFADKTLHVGLNDNSNSFEPPSRKKGDLDEAEEIKRLSGEIKEIFSFVDTLELHKNIFRS